MKRIICFLLCFLLVFNNAYIVLADIHGGSSGSLDDPTKLYPNLFDENGNFKPPAGQELFDHMILGNATGEAAASILDVITSFLGGYDNSNGQGISVETNSGGSTVHFHGSFIDELNAALQDKVHALDGYYLFEPQGDISLDNFRKLEPDFLSNASKNDINRLSDFSFVIVPPLNKSYGYLNFYSPRSMNSNEFFSVTTNGEVWLRNYDPSSGRIGIPHNGGSMFYYKVYSSGGVDWTDYSTITLSKLKEYSNRILGSPFKVFYSIQDYLNWRNKGITYVPKLPSSGFKVNIKYINNTTNLPDITYNITTENKTETEIQNQYDTIINNYLNGLDDFTDGGGENNPTPTPSGGGSGDFGDGSTPTPTPPLGDGGSDQDGDGSDGWLKKIYDHLVKLSDSVSQHFEKEETFEDKLSKYLESHDKKLDAIVDAIDKLNQGKEEGEEKGCKYDYTKLSDFMTKLWNDSDQKFDQMVELLKENNEYQEKMLSTLNSIKNILLAQTVMDAFKNRSSETANKAKEKFPTSVPWDIALIVNAMDAEPKAPVFELPVKIERLNIDEKITVDISSGEWEKLAKACRYMLSLLFVLFMVNLTRKLFFSKGDD